MQARAPRSDSPPYDAPQRRCPGSRADTERQLGVGRQKRSPWTAGRMGGSSDRCRPVRQIWRDPAHLIRFDQDRPADGLHASSIFAIPAHRHRGRRCPVASRRGPQSPWVAALMELGKLDRAVYDAVDSYVEGRLPFTRVGVGSLRGCSPASGERGRLELAVRPADPAATVAVSERQDHVRIAPRRNSFGQRQLGGRTGAVGLDHRVGAHASWHGCAGPPLLTLVEAPGPATMTKGVQRDGEAEDRRFAVVRRSHADVTRGLSKRVIASWDLMSTT